MLLVLSSVACEPQAHEVVVTNERIGQPAGPNAAMYFTATANGDDRLIGASSDVAAEVQIHEVILDDHGGTGMHPLDGLDLNEGEDLVFEPGGYHLMLIEVERLAVGETVDVVLEWETAGEMTVRAPVVAPEDTVAGDS